jgi:hypothetical protein
MLDELLNRFIEERDMISRAPYSFTIATIFALAISLLVLNFHYSGVIDQQAATIGRQKKELSDRQSLIERYQLELNLTAARNRFFYMSNAQLITAVHDFIPKLVAFQNKWESKIQRLYDEQFAQMAPHAHVGKGSISPAEQAQLADIFHQYNQQEDILYQQREQEYDQNLKDEAILLREEMLSRLPPTVLHRCKYCMVLMR